MRDKIIRSIEQTDLFYGFLTNDGGVEQSGVICVNDWVEGEKAWKVLKKKVGVDAILIDCAHRTNKYSMDVETFISNAEIMEG